MAIWTIFKNMTQGIPELPWTRQLNGYDSLTDCIWNDAMVQNTAKLFSPIRTLRFPKIV